MFCLDLDFCATEEPGLIIRGFRKSILPILVSPRKESKVIRSGEGAGAKTAKKRLPTCFTLVRRLNFLYFRKMKDLTKDKFI